MKKAVLFALALLAVIAPAASAELGFGLTAGYPVGYAFYYQANYGGLPDPAPIFWGVTVKWKPSGLLVDSGIGYWDAGSSTSFLYGYLDLGVGLDLWIFRLGLAGGVDVINVSAPGYPSYSAVGLSAKPSLEVRLGPVTVGASMAFPLDIILAVMNQENVMMGDNFLRIFAGHASLYLVYWL
jgi:hypothetical protein